MATVTSGILDSGLNFTGIPRRSNARRAQPCPEPEIVTVHLLFCCSGMLISRKFALVTSHFVSCVCPPPPTHLSRWGAIKYLENAENRPRILDVKNSARLVVEHLVYAPLTRHWLWQRTLWPAF